MFQRVVLLCVAVVTALPAAAEPPRLDSLGDPLPAGALTRLGKMRMRQPGPITGIVYTPDGKTLLTAESPGGTSETVVCIWDIATGKEQGRINLRQLSTSCPALSPDGTTLVTCSGALWSLHHWDVTSCEELLQHPAPSVFT